jgi:hypothetical protein
MPEEQAPQASQHSERLNAADVPIGALVESRCGCKYRRVAPYQHDPPYPWFVYVEAGPNCAENDVIAYRGDRTIRGPGGHEVVIGMRGWSFDKKDYRIIEEKRPPQSGPH